MNILFQSFEMYLFVCMLLIFMQTLLARRKNPIRNLFEFPVHPLVLMMMSKMTIVMKENNTQVLLGHLSLQFFFGSSYLFYGRSYKP